MFPMIPRAATFRRNVILLVSAACVVRVWIWFASWRTVESFSESASQVEHAQAVLGALESMRSGLLSVALREPDAERIARQRLSALLDLAKDEAGQEALPAELPPLVEKRQLKKAMARLDAARDAERALLTSRVRAQQERTARVLKSIAALAIGSIVVLIAVACWLVPAFDERATVRDRLRPT